MHLRPQFQRKARVREKDFSARAERLKILLDVTPGKQKERLAAKILHQRNMGGKL